MCLNNRFFLFLLVCILCWACKDAGEVVNGRNDMIVKSSVVTPSYMGNGVQ